jgi:hypothetical protein
MPIDPTISALVGTAIGALAGIAGTIFSTLIIQRSEERRHLRQVVINAAIENWKQVQIAAGKLTDAGYRVDHYPLDTYVIHMMKLVSILNERDLSPDRIRARMRELHSVTSAAAEEIDRHHAPQ